ncbi:MAG: ferrochelatase [Neisseria sp.]|nr:ferrochelatase [Neisseria sp.]
MALFLPENGTVETPLPSKSGVLLLNLGSPAAPTAAAVRPYLAQFLSDQRVVEKKAWQWLPILHGVILRLRPAKSAALYRHIWQENGSPLIVHTHHLAAALAARLSVPVYSAMTYGNPSVLEVVQRMKQDGITRMVCLPLFPQYAGSAGGAALDALWRTLLRSRYQPSVTTVSDFHAFPPYIAALAAKIRRSWQAHGRGEVLVLSFHGIPLAQHTAGDPYVAQCYATARALAQALEMGEQDYRVTFQSHFGRDPWVKPATQAVLHELPAQGIRKIDVTCPGFVCDCLETLEEIALSGKEIFTAAGGEAYHYIGCLNDEAENVEALAQLLALHLG